MRVRARQGLSGARLLVCFDTARRARHAGSQLDYHYLTAQGEWKVDGQFLFSSADERKDGFGGFADIRRNFGQGRRLHLGYSYYDEELDINDLGFLKRNDLRGSNGRYEVTHSDSPRYRKRYISYWYRWSETVRVRMCKRTRCGCGS